MLLNKRDVKFLKNALIIGTFVCQKFYFSIELKNHLSYFLYIRCGIIQCKKYLLQSAFDDFNYQKYASEDSLLLHVDPVIYFLYTIFV